MESHLFPSYSASKGKVFQISLLKKEKGPHLKFQIQIVQKHIRDRAQRTVKIAVNSGVNRNAPKQKLPGSEGESDQLRLRPRSSNLKRSWQRIFRWKTREDTDSLLR